MTATIATPNAAPRQVVLLQIVTLGWMTIECAVALSAAWRAHSAALLAFGSDSAVELISAGVVLLQYSPKWRIEQTRAARACGALLYALAAIVTCIALAALFLRAGSDTSRLGIAVTVGALVLMPLLARWKKIAAARFGDRALRADAVQSATCAYLAALTLGGLLLRLSFGLRWIDSVAALAAVPILLIEGRRARKGQTCACC